MDAKQEFVGKLKDDPIYHAEKALEVMIDLEDKFDKEYDISFFEDDKAEFKQFSRHIHDALKNVMSPDEIFEEIYLPLRKRQVAEGLPHSALMKGMFAAAKKKLQ